jgi:hypothetical protein
MCLLRCLEHTVIGWMLEQKLPRLTRDIDDRLAMDNVTADLVTSKEQQTIFIREFRERVRCSSDIHYRGKKIGLFWRQASRYEAAYGMRSAKSSRSCAWAEFRNPQSAKIFVQQPVFGARGLFPRVCR